MEWIIVWMWMSVMLALMFVVVKRLSEIRDLLAGKDGNQ